MIRQRLSIQNSVTCWKGDLRELDENGNTLEGGITVEVLL